MKPEVVNEEECQNLLNEFNSVNSGPCEVVLDATFENYTPYMGGGAYGTTFHCLDTCCKSYKASPPTGETVKGRMRWLARIAVGTGQGYRTDERIVSKFMGYVRPRNARTSAVRVAVIPSKCGEPYLGYEAVRELVNAAIEYDTSYLGKPHRIISLFEAAGYAMFARERRWGEWVGVRSLDAELAPRSESNRRRSNDPFKKFIGAVDRYGAQDFMKLFTIPRFKLLAMKACTRLKESLKMYHDKNRAVDEAARVIFENQPAKPGTVRFKLIVSVDEGLIERGICCSESVKRLAFLLGLATPMLGLGKATTRGFGLFKLVELSEPQQRGTGFREGGVAAAVRGGLNGKLLIRLLREISEVSSRLCAEGVVGAGGEPVRTPSLRYALENAVADLEVVHPCPVPMHCYYNKLTTRNSAVRKLCCDFRVPVSCDTLLLLSAIGTACLKNVWKIRIKGRSVRSRGYDLDTWVLGLPRMQNNRGYYCYMHGYAQGKVSEISPGRRLSSVTIWASPQGLVTLLPLAAAPDILTCGERGKLHHKSGRRGRRSLAAVDYYEKLREVLEYLRGLLTGALRRCPPVIRNRR